MPLDIAFRPSEVLFQTREKAVVGWIVDSIAKILRGWEPQRDVATDQQGM